MKTNTADITSHTNQSLQRGRCAEHVQRMLQKMWQHKNLHKHRQVVEYIRSNAPLLRVYVQLTALCPREHDSSTMSGALLQHPRYGSRQWTGCVAANADPFQNGVRGQRSRNGAAERLHRVPYLVACIVGTDTIRIAMGQEDLREYFADWISESSRRWMVGFEMYPDDAFLVWKIKIEVIKM